MIFRGNTFLLKPTPEQAEKFERESSLCRLVYNLALEQRRDWYRQYQRNTGNNLNWVTQSKELTALRAEFEFIRDGSVAAQQIELSILEKAFKAFFRGGGYPKFRKKGVKERFSCQGRDILIESLNAKWSRVRIPKVGWVKFRQTRDIEGTVFGATVSRTEIGWQVSFNSKIEGDAINGGGRVGIDRGVAVPLALSDGRTFFLPESMSHLDRVHRKAQRTASRRKRGSNRHAKAQKRVRNIAARKARIRKDWAHRATTHITRQYGTVVIERLRTKDMTKSAPGKRGLNRVILNVGWHQIESMLSYKAFRLIKVNPAHTSQTCAPCGHVDSKSRKSQASFVCTRCGHTANADTNAAINILQRGNTALLDVEGCGYAPCEASTAVMATAA